MPIKNRLLDAELPQGLKDQLHLRFRRPGDVLRPLAVPETGPVEGEDPMPVSEPIDKGEKVSGTIVYDVSKDARIVKVRLHDSALSKGVEITL